MKVTVASLILAGFMVGAAYSGPASAQSASPPPDASAPGDPSGNLSDKLNKSNGVIRPEGDVDPKMQKAAPATGSMPVIPPPGAPGGQTGVQPK